MPMTDRDLDQLFAAIRDETAHPTAGLKARMLADARASRHGSAMPPPVRSRRAPGLLDRIADLFGGWMPVGGLTACLVAGITFGALPDSALPFLPASDTSEISLSLSLGDTLFADMTQ